MKDIRYKLPQSYDVSLLKKDLETALNYKWKDHFHHEDYAGTWRAIPLYSIGGEMNNLMPVGDSTMYKSTSLLSKCSYFRTILDQFECPKESVRLLKLDPNSVIKTHSDPGLSYTSGSFRIHIPIQTHSELHFYQNHERVALEEGSCWYLNFELLHRVENKGTIPRVHLVIDCERNEWSDKLFRQLGFDFEYEEKMKYAHYSIEDIEHIIHGLKESNAPEMNPFIKTWEQRLEERKINIH